VEYNSTSEQLARLWDEYVEAARWYEAAKQATDIAQAVRDRACEACERAHEAWETACDEEVHYGEVMRQRAGEFRAALDAAFLTECGIQPDPQLSGWPWLKGELA
jgi:hypothetical protein